MRKGQGFTGRLDEVVDVEDVDVVDDDVEVVDVEDVDVVDDDVVGCGPFETTIVTVEPTSTSVPDGGSVRMTTLSGTTAENSSTVATWKPSWPSVFDAVVAD